MVEREDFEVVRQVRKSRLHHIYWVLYTCATVYSFIVTMCYWLLVHDPGMHREMLLWAVNFILSFPILFQKFTK